MAGFMTEMPNRTFLVGLSRVKGWFDLAIGILAREKHG